MCSSIFDMEELNSALDNSEFNFDSMFAALTEIEEDIIYTQPAIRAYNDWINRIFMHTLPKHRRRWINLIRNQFGKIKVYLTKSDIEKYIDTCKIPLEIRKILRQVANGNFTTISIDGQDVIMIRIVTDPEKIYQQLIKKGLLIEKTNSQRVYRGYTTIEDSKCSEIIHLTPPKRIKV